MRHHDAVAAPTAVAHEPGRRPHKCGPPRPSPPTLEAVWGSVMTTNGLKKALLRTGRVREARSFYPSTTTSCNKPDLLIVRAGSRQRGGDP